MAIDKVKNDYDANSIQVLDGLEAVRKRPGMYIGNTNAQGLRHLVFEIIDNSVDEALAGHCNKIDVTFNSDGSVTVQDNGRGIPIGKMADGRNALEVIFTTLHAGGKFGQGNYKTSGGLHGVGTSVVTALSEWLEVTVSKDGKQHYIKFENGGHPVGKLKVIGKVDKSITGTMVRFKSDDEIFGKIKMNVEQIAERMRETSFLMPELVLNIHDQRDIDPEVWTTEVYHNPDGLKAYTSYLAENNSVISEATMFQGLDTATDIEMDIAFQYVESLSDGSSLENVVSFVNNVRTKEGGKHEEGFKIAFTRAVNDYAKNTNLLKGKITRLDGNDIREGLNAVISIRVPENILQFEGQTKGKLGTQGARGALEVFTYDNMLTYLTENNETATYLVERAIRIQKLREEMKKARQNDKKVAKKGNKNALPEKLVEPMSKDPKVRELYLVEGDSAGGCHTIDTTVFLADGTVKTFGELLSDFEKGKDNFVYGFDNEKGTGFNAYKILDVFKTKVNTKVIRLTFDDGSQVKVTPEHLYLLKNGTWKEAQHLKPTDSLRAMYTQETKKGYVSNAYNANHINEPLVHRAVVTKYLGEIPEGYDVHHIDENKQNNYPTNLEYWEHGSHSSYHNLGNRENGILDNNHLAKVHLERWENDPDYKERTLKHLDKAQKEYWSSDENRKAQSERVIKNFEDNPNRKQELSDLAKEQWDNEELKLWRAEKTKEQMAKVQKIKIDNSLSLLVDMKISGIDFDRNTYQEQRKLKMNGSKKHVDGIYPYYELLNKFDNNLDSILEARDSFNHRVINIEWLTKKEDVYDITVDEVHNFALGNGVIVHNSAKQGRNRLFQGVLPLRGKGLNTENVTKEAILNNLEFSGLFDTLGVKPGKDFNIEDLRYHKIVLMTDADVDGAHIQTLLLTLFYRHLPKLIEEGCVYIALAPLYAISSKKVDKNKPIIYCWSEHERQEAVEKYGGSSKVNIGRFKGLGEMNATQLWETTLDPDVRVFQQVTLSDRALANRTFTTLMGPDAEPRRAWINKNIDFGVEAEFKGRNILSEEDVEEVSSDTESTVIVEE